MANVTVSISTAKLQFAIAYIEGMKLAAPKTTDNAIETALTSLGYTPIEIYMIKSTKTTEVVETVFNPPIHHRAKSQRKPKAEVKNTVEFDDDTIEDDNVLGI